MCDVEPIEHGLVVNIGDLLQILSNDKFESIIHRVVVKNVGPRISVACFFSFVSPKMFGPIKELISEENPEFQVKDNPSGDFKGCIDISKKDHGLSQIKIMDDKYRIARPKD
ncbi:hypothetical protein H5410_053071 [Solanum commersonii]|uniref:Isopenicillin N synthase-like Fe(2+) 2OG dioxygenase domain-containing protein n=1 Tax=Solanum commersonii TaxID=4109 RepID=A0A9J5X581_SOLCO|nr:hypothetical protein H5410_053071 [Solanum commersonii]